MPRRARSNTKERRERRGNSEIQVRHVRGIRSGRAAMQKGFGGGLGRGGGEEVSWEGGGQHGNTGEWGLVVAAAHGETLQLPCSRSREDCAGIAAALFPNRKSTSRFTSPGLEGRSTT